MPAEARGASDIGIQVVIGEPVLWGKAERVPWFHLCIFQQVSRRRRADRDSYAIRFLVPFAWVNGL